MSDAARVPLSTSFPAVGGWREGKPQLAASQEKAMTLVCPTCAWVSVPSGNSDTALDFTVTSPAQTLEMAK